MGRELDLRVNILEYEGQALFRGRETATVHPYQTDYVQIIGSVMYSMFSYAHLYSILFLSIFDI